MLRFMRKYLRYSQIVTKSDKQYSSTADKATHNFALLFHDSKVPTEPAIQPSPAPLKDISVDSEDIQLLERLSLVDLDSKEALATLKSSIQFADNIAHLDTTGIRPLYTVQETQNLKLRADTVTDGDCCELILSNAKVTDENYFVSPPGNIPLQQVEKSFLKN